MSSILNTYNRKKISFKKGSGSYLYSSNGKKYLDFVQGIAVNCLGHSNKYLIDAVNKQSKTGWSPLIVAASKGHLETVKVGFNSQV